MTDSGKFMRLFRWITLTSLIVAFLICYHKVGNFPPEYYVWGDVIEEVLWKVFIANIFLPPFAIIFAMQDTPKQLHCTFDVHLWVEIVVCGFISLNVFILLICFYQRYFGEVWKVAELLDGLIYALIVPAVLGGAWVYQIRQRIKERRQSRSMERGEVDSYTIRIGDSVYAMSYNAPETCGVVYDGIKGTNKVIVIVTLYHVIKVYTIFSDNFLALDKSKKRGDVPLVGYSYGSEYEEDDRR